jgi:hypothetical protein
MPAITTDLSYRLLLLPSPWKPFGALKSALLILPFYPLSSPLVSRFDSFGIWFSIVISGSTAILQLGIDLSTWVYY